MLIDPQLIDYYSAQYSVVSFLSRVSILTRDTDNSNFVRPSVRHTPVLDENGLTY